jgi:hypothetical protein
LERKAQNVGVSLDNIVQRVEAPANRVETLLRAVRDGGVGRFELFLGKSGSGKTPFLKTLSRFFDHVAVDTIPVEVKLPDVAASIRERDGPRDGSSGDPAGNDQRVYSPATPRRENSRTP